MDEEQDWWQRMMGGLGQMGNRFVGGLGSPGVSNMLTGLGLGLVEAGGPSTQPANLGTALMRGVGLAEGMNSRDAQREYMMGRMEEGKKKAEKEKSVAQARERLALWQDIQDGKVDAQKAAQNGRVLPAGYDPSPDLAAAFPEVLEERIKGQKPPEGMRRGPGGEWTPDPGYLAMKAAIAQAGRNNVTVVNQQETEFQKGLGKSLADNYNAMQQAGFKSQTLVNNLKTVDALLDRVETGRFAPSAIELAKAAKAVGIELPNADQIGPAEAAVAIRNKLSLAMRGPGDMAGPMSDRDIQFLQNMTPDLTTTKEGRKLMIDMHARAAKREQEMAQMARDYRKANGGKFDEGFYERAQTYADRNPLFTDADVERMRTVRAAAPAAPAAGATPQLPPGTPPPPPGAIVLPTPQVQVPAAPSPAAPAPAARAPTMQPPGAVSDWERRQRERDEELRRQYAPYLRR